MLLRTQLCLLAKLFLEKNPNSTFTYVTGAGTDSTESGTIHWARIKGKTENELLRMPFKKSYMFRPGYIHPMKGVGSRTLWIQLLYKIIGVLYVFVFRCSFYIFNFCFVSINYT